MQRFEMLEVTVETVDAERYLALVRDQFGNTKNVRTDILRAKGPAPEPGENWIIDRSLGPWTFAAIVGYRP